MATYAKDFIIYNTSHGSVEVTGSWCNWQRGKHHLTKIPNLYYITTVELPLGEKVLYKYIIDGDWQHNPLEPLETGSDGVTNNVFQVPERNVADETPSFDADTTQGVEKVGPGVVEATSSGTGVEDDTLAKPETISAANTIPTTLAFSAGTSTSDASAAHLRSSGVSGTESNVALVPNGATAPGTTAPAPVTTAPTTTSAAASPRDIPFAEPASSASTNISAPPAGSRDTPASAGLAAAAGAAAGASASNSNSPASMPSQTKAPLPASTGDAPVAPGTKTHEGQGLFSAISHIATAAGAVATAAAERAVHVFDEPTSPRSTTSVSSEAPKTATQTPAPGVTGQQASVPTIPSSDKIASELKSHPTPTAQNASPVSSATASKDPAAALQPIATNDGVNKITSELGAVDLEHTKREITNLVESLGGAIAGTFATLGESHEATPTLKSTGGLNTTTSSAPSGTSATSGTSKPAYYGETRAPNAQDAAGSYISTSKPSMSSTAASADSSKPSYLGETRTANARDAAGTYISTGKPSATSTAAPIDSSKPSYLGETRAPNAQAATGTYIDNGKPTAMSSTTTSAAPAVSSVPVVPSTATTASEKEMRPVAGTTATPAATSKAAPAVARTTSETGSVGKKEGLGAKLKKRVSRLDSSTSSDAAHKESSAAPAGAVTATTASPAAAPATPKKSTTASAATAPGVTGTKAADANASIPRAGSKKENSSSVGIGSAPSSQAAPVTPQKNGAAAVGGTPASARTNDYKTAPSTPATPATPADNRKRKSSFFAKVKQAFKSP